MHDAGQPACAARPGTVGGRAVAWPGPGGAASTSVRSGRERYFWPTPLHTKAGQGVLAYGSSDDGINVPVRKGSVLSYRTEFLPGRGCRAGCVTGLLKPCRRMKLPTKRVCRLRPHDKNRFSLLIATGFIAGSLVLATGGIAQATEMPNENLSSTGVSLAQSSLSVAALEGNKVVASSGDKASSITLPGESVTPKQVDVSNVPADLFSGKGSPVASTVLAEASVTSFKTETGTQTLISIESASASADYRFSLSLPDEVTASLETDGSVSVRDPAGVVAGKYLEPWAVDANGDKVETSFALQGNTLVQTVEFDSTTAFPIVADPEWWQTATSAAAGTAAGVAIVAGIPGVGATVGAIAGGCVTGAMNAMWDGASFWGGFRACLVGAAIGFIAGAAGSIVKNVLARYGVGV